MKGGQGAALRLAASWRHPDDDPYQKCEMELDKKVTAIAAHQTVEARAATRTSHRVIDEPPRRHSATLRTAAKPQVAIFLFSSGVLDGE
ncbi:MAG: hypothetical protein SFX73_28075 [Kofleriaceae bacterium]|nr:hypothetical protein [Kofleriaceae bacterium]